MPSLSGGRVVLTEGSCGRAACCALDVTGRVWCWGENQLGVLGRGATSADDFRPATVCGAQ